MGQIDILPGLLPRVPTDTPTYTSGETCNKPGGKEESAEWVRLLDGRILVPETWSRDLITQVHQRTESWYENVFNGPRG